MNPPSSEAVELALEIVNLHARPARAASAACTLESLALDNLDRVNLAMEIEDRWGGVVSEHELLEWHDLADIARTIESAQRRAA